MNNFRFFRLKLPIYRQSTNYRSAIACLPSVLRYAKYDFDIREDSLGEALESD